jgi:hypothetical protein
MLFTTRMENKVRYSTRSDKAAVPELVYDGTSHAEADSGDDREKVKREKSKNS